MCKKLAEAAQQLKNDKEQMADKLASTEEKVQRLKALFSWDDDAKSPSSAT